MFGQIEPAVQRGDEWGRLAREQREWIVIEMKVQKIELVGAPPHVLQHVQVQRERVADRAVEAQRARREWLKLGRRARIAAGEQRDLVPERDEFLDEPVNDPFGSAVKPGRNGLRQRGNLRNVHEGASSSNP